MRYLALLLLLIPAISYGFDVPLTVTETAGIVRSQEPVSTGIPFSLAENVTSVAAFGVFDGSTEIPAQFTVTSRWHGAPSDTGKAIRWVLVEFMADCGANANKVYTLKTTGGSGTAATGITLTDLTGTVTVNTGEAEVVVNKTAFNLFDRVRIKDPTAGNTLTREVVSSGGAGAYLTSSAAVDYLAKNNTTSVSVERSGPIHTVILATGKHRNGTTDNLNWKARLHFWKGKAFVKVDYSVTEVDTLSLITAHSDLDKIVLPLTLAKSGDTTYSLAGDSTVHTGALTASQTATLLQTGSIDQGSISTTGSSAQTADEGAASTITYTLGGQASGSGVHSKGWADLSDGDKGITVAVRYFWQLYPKKFELSNTGAVNVHLWPSEAADLIFYAAAQKTHEVLYYFHNGTATDAGSANLVESMYGVTTSYTSTAAESRHHWLFPVADHTRYANTKALGYVGVSDTTAYPAEHQALVSSYYGYISNLLDRSLKERNTGGTRGGGHEYMMWNFGDSRDATWSNMAYDAVRADALIFAATGDRRFFDHMEESAQHFRDVDVEHNTVSTNRGTASSLTAKWLGRTRYNPADGGQHDLGYAGRVTYGFEHFKGQGLADHYFLTGDALSKDVLAEAYNYVATWKAVENTVDDSGVRAASKPLGIAIGQYLVTGSSTAKADADYIINHLNTWQRRVGAKNPDGLIWAGTSSSQSSAQVGLTLNFMMEYMKDIPSATNVAQNILDACGFIVNPANLYWTGTYFNDWPNNNYDVPHASVIDFMAVGGLGYCAKVGGNTTLIDIGKTSLTNGISQDTSNGNLKPYGQKTRYAPGFLYFLQTDSSVSGATIASPTHRSLIGRLSGRIR